MLETYAYMEGKQKHTYVRWGYRHTYTLSKLNSEEAARLLGGERGGKVWHIIVHMMYIQGRRHWVGRVGICPPSFQRSEATNPSKLQNSCNLHVLTVDAVKI